MLDAIYNKEKIESGNASEEMLSIYKAKKGFRLMGMSTFDYDIQKDKIYVYKKDVRLHGFTDYWFQDGGDFYYLEKVTETLYRKGIVRDSCAKGTLHELNKIKHNISGKVISFETPLIYENGAAKWTYFTVYTLVDADSNPLYAIGHCKDITEEKKKSFSERKAAHTDALTGLRNKDNGIMKVGKLLKEEKKEQHFLAVITLAHFENAIDLSGMTFGEQILKSVAARIDEFGDNRSIKSRNEADEYMFFRLCSNEEDAMEKLSELKNRIRHLETLNDLEFPVEAHIGFAMYPSQGKEFEELYKKAVCAMRYAKKNEADGPVLYIDGMK